MHELSKKQVFIMAGYPGSGKSTLAKKIAKKFGCKHLVSDNFRQQTKRPARYANKDDAAINDSRNQAYMMMYQAALDCLRVNEKVVLDATHLEPAKRKPVLDKLLSECEASAICFVNVVVPYEIIDERMQELRNQKNSDPADGKFESMYDAWKRVYGYFLNRKKQGRISWPNPNDGIDVISHEEIITQLD